MGLLLNILFANDSLKNNDNVFKARSSHNGNKDLGDKDDITGGDLVLAVLILHVAVISDDGEDPAQHCSRCPQHVRHTCGVVPAIWRTYLETPRRPGLVAVVFGMSRQ